MPQPKRFLLRHLGNMGDMVFFVPPVLETLKKKYPGCHITFVTAWGYKQKVSWAKSPGTFFKALALRQRPQLWGERNQGGFSIALLLTNPHIDQLVHWHDTKLDREGNTCVEEGRHCPTWNKTYYEQQKNSGEWDHVYELDFGLKVDDNPIQKMYELIGFPEETFSNYRLYFTDKDKKVAAAVMEKFPHPRIVLLESLDAENTRGWDTTKIPELEQQIQATYGVPPIWFGGNHIPSYQGKLITLRQNIATLLYADVAIGVLSGPLHFAAATGAPTITLYGDQPLHRAAPAYFLNEYIGDPARQHQTLLGPTPTPLTFLKDKPATLSPREQRTQHFRSWLAPGRQATKSCLAPITPEEVLTVLTNMVPIPHA